MNWKILVAAKLLLVGTQLVFLYDHFFLPFPFFLAAFSASRAKRSSSSFASIALAASSSLYLSTRGWSCCPPARAPPPPPSSAGPAQPGSPAPPPPPPPPASACGPASDEPPPPPQLLAQLQPRRLAALLDALQPVLDVVGGCDGQRRLGVLVLARDGGAALQQQVHAVLVVAGR
eukprot:CAMPEP_0114322404 /NCGR_PEP_ID=MMETSP0059-20121206/27209_1 /TAXON_ID=36894 /ORGANISM="Pyramimonas parkeae, Strain CCMP726" /LENGTH=174 /DNA_ID=CAMNT_0001450381 /DNA_START=147 /DNA_END=670 /DNA_ORIENTATION=+